jgi:hypothetical protein
MMSREILDLRMRVMNRQTKIAYCVLYLLVVLSCLCTGIGLILLWRVSK